MPDNQLRITSASASGIAAVCPTHAVTEGLCTMERFELSDAWLTTELTRMQGLPPYGLAVLERLHVHGPQTTGELAEFLNEPPESVETTESRLAELKTIVWLTQRGLVQAAASSAGSVDSPLGITPQGLATVHRIAQQQTALATAAAG